MEDKILVKVTTMNNDSEVCTFSVDGTWQEKDLIKLAMLKIVEKMGDDVNRIYQVVIMFGDKMLLIYVNIVDFKPVVMGIIDTGVDDIRDLISESKDLKDAKNALENLLDIYHKFNDTLDKYIAMKEIQEKLEKLVKGEMKNER